MITPAEFLKTIHEIAYQVQADQFESAVREVCQRLAREIQSSQEFENDDSYPRPNRS